MPLPNVGYLIIITMILQVALAAAAMLHKRKRLQLVISTALFVLISQLAIAIFAQGTSQVILDTFVTTSFAALFIFVFSIALVLINILTYKHSKDYLSLSLLLSLVALGSYSIAMAYSLPLIVLGLELITLPSAFMILLSGKEHVEAAVKLFVIAAIGVSIFAFALALIYPYSPDLTLVAVSPSAMVTGNYVVMLALLLFIAALAFDASIFPFNLWVPDVYKGAPANITALLAGINKKVAFIALFEIIFVLMYNQLAVSSFIFEILAILTMFFGNIAALVQTNIKRLFAYSSISQAGYIAIGIASGTIYGLSASIFQIIAHTFMIIGTFAIILLLEENNINSMNDYNGLASRNKMVAFALTIFMLSMIGIPALSGFIGKFLLFTSAIDRGLVILAIIAIINSFISVYYYAKVIMAMYARKESKAIKPDWAVAAVALTCLAITIIIGVYPQPIITLSTIAAQSLSVL